MLQLVVSIGSKVLLVSRECELRIQPDTLIYIGQEVQWGWGRGGDQPVLKCPLCNHEDLSPSPSICGKGSMVAHPCDPSAGEAERRGFLSRSGQPTQPHARI